MARTVGLGNQILLYNYRTDLDWDILNNTFVNLFSAGILTANLNIIDCSTFEVNYISAFIIPENSPKEIIKMETTSPFNISITDPTTEIYLKLRFEFQLNEFNAVQFILSNNPSEPTHPYDIIVARLVYDGTNCLIDFDYTMQTKSYGTHLHDDRYYTKTEVDNLIATHTHYLSTLADVDDTNKADGRILMWNATTSMHEYVDVSATSDTYKAMVSNTDTTPDYLLNKFTEGIATQVSRKNAGANEQLAIDLKYNNTQFTINASNELELIASTTVNTAKEIFDVDTTIATTKQITLSNTPQANSEIISLNGQILTPGSTRDYEISGNTITFYTDLYIGDVIIAQYNY